MTTHRVKELIGKLAEEFDIGIEHMEVDDQLVFGLALIMGRIS